MNFLNPRLARRLAIFVIILFVVGLIFRFAIYKHMYIAPDAPYGVSDLIEYFLSLLLITVGAASILVTIALAIKGPRSNRIASAWLFGICAAIAILIVPLHGLAAKWAI